MGETDNKMCEVPDNILEDLRRDVSQIKTALLGNEYNDHRGLLCGVKELEDDNKSMKERFNKIVWTGIGVGSGAGFVWYILTEVLSKILQ